MAQVQFRIVEYTGVKATERVSPNSRYIFRFEPQEEVEAEGVVVKAGGRKVCMVQDLLQDDNCIEFFSKLCRDRHGKNQWKFAADLEAAVRSGQFRQAFMDNLEFIKAALAGEDDKDEPLPFKLPARKRTG